MKLNGLEFSFSGIQNKAETFYSDTQSAADTARFVMNCIVSCIADATRTALAQYPGLRSCFPAASRPTPCCGSVCGSLRLFLPSRNIPRTTPWGSPF